MKYGIYINQLVLSKHETADLNDGAILDYIHFISSSANEKIEAHRLHEPDGVWTWLDLSRLMDDLPLIRYVGKSSISKRLDKLVDYGYILKKKHRKLNRLFVRKLPLFDELLADNSKGGVSVQKQVGEGGVSVEQHPDARGVSVEQHPIYDNSTNDNSTNFNTPKKIEKKSTDEKVPVTVQAEDAQPPAPHSNNSKVYAITQKEYLLSLQDSDITWFHERSRFPSVSAEDIRKCAAQAYYWLESKGETRKDHRAFLYNWLVNYTRRNTQRRARFEE